MDSTRNRLTTIRTWLCLTVGLSLLLLFGGCAGPAYITGAGNFHTVIVDAGHGGHDRGAKSVSGQPEKVLALDTARRLAIELRKQGFNVIETRNADYFVPLGGRTAISNRKSDAIFVSIHYNWAPKRKPQGVEVYYYSSRSGRLAANILQEIKTVYPTKNRGVKRNNYYVLRNNRRPAVLCELGFLSNPSDNRYVQTAAVRQKLAEEIAWGITKERQGRIIW